ncbi:MAG: restriction endonuclease subunit S, partial [Algicola sp.]|nr:restriction endonuclease subunit S [Algicola sp.]
MPNNWKTYKLSEVTTKIGSGATPRGGKEAYKDSGTSLIRSQNVLDFNFSTDGLAFIDEEQASKLKNVIIEKDDVLLNITGDSVARVCSVPSIYLPARVNQHVAIVRADNKNLDADYLKYSLLENSNKSLLLTYASAGATRNALTKSMIENFELKLPPLPEQKAIAKILSAIDDKIENNLAINKTLEDMAMALYKHWFVDFGPFQEGNFVESELGLIPEGWEVSNIGTLYKTSSGGTPSRKKMEYYDKGTIPWIKSKELNNSFIIDTEEKITEIA